MNGLLLAGGSSQRMGFNKALLKIGGEPLILRMARILKQVVDEVFVVARDVKAYSSLGVKVIEDRFSVKGAMVGICSGLLTLKDHYLFVTACDMPSLSPRTVKLICDSSDGYDVTLPRINGYLEPLCAVYSRRCIDPMKTLIKKGDLRIVHVFPTLKVRYLDKEFLKNHGIDEGVFENLNSPEEWRKWLDSSDGWDGSDDL